MKQFAEPDNQIIEQARAGNRQAQEKLLRFYEKRLFGFVLSMVKNRHLAEDITQECFIKVIKNLPKYKEQGHFKAWLFQIAYREVLQHHRKQKRRRTQLSENPETENGQVNQQLSNEGAASEKMLQNEKLSELREAIKQLPEVERDVVCMRTYSSLSFKEISKLMKCPLNTTLGRMHNAMKRLKSNLRNRKPGYELQ